MTGKPLSTDNGRVNIIWFTWWRTRYLKRAAINRTMLVTNAFCVIYRCQSQNPNVLRATSAAAVVRFFDKRILTKGNANVYQWTVVDTRRFSSPPPLSVNVNDPQKIHTRIYSFISVVPNEQSIAKTIRTSKKFEPVLQLCNSKHGHGRGIANGV